ncbi:MAG TPA: flavin reductase family protein [Acidimicrobiales bacterium]|nr:flavin reductase family protein [Acidimicrobiales bacterium]
MPLVGPFPPGVDPQEYDRLRRRVLWRMPSGIYLLGSVADGRSNLMTHNWAMQVSTAPKLMAVSVRTDAVSHDLIVRGRVFSLCFLKRQDRVLARSFTKPAQDDGPTLAGQPVRRGLTGAPILAASPAWLECEVRTQVPAGDHSIFVGEVVGCGVEDESAPLLRMEDTRMNYGG